MLTCELSGEVLVGDDAVVTPSGHICSKRLLLQKLTENGGRDPFVQQPLHEEQLISLKNNNKSFSILPRVAATNNTSSFAGLCSELQVQYDAVVLELMDTRAALEETRQELSQALYQNDAAVRVVARLARERDSARQQLLQWQPTTTTVDNSHVLVVEEDATTTMPHKKRRIQETNGAAVEDAVGAMEDTTMTSEQKRSLSNNIPATDLQDLLGVWETLHTSRKARQKDAAALAPTVEQLASYKLTETKAWHKTTCRGITAMAYFEENNNNNNNNDNTSILLTAGKDKQLVLYDLLQKVVVHTISPGKKAAAITAVQINDRFMVAGYASGDVRVWSTSEANVVGELPASSSNDPVVDVRLHASGKHLVVAFEGGSITLVRLSAKSPAAAVVPIALLKSNNNSYKLTCGALHPDGLIYICGTATGELLVWDLKSQSLVITLKAAGGDNDDTTSAAVVHVSHSNNGYHVAAAHANGKVCVWDLRKQQVIVTFNSANAPLESVESTCFDPAGKYLAYGGSGGVHIMALGKKLESSTPVAAKLDCKLASGLAWTSSHQQQDAWIVATSNKNRQVGFFSAAVDSDNQAKDES